METNKPINNEQLTIDNEQAIDNLKAELAAKTDIITDLSSQIDELKKELAERDFREAEAHINALIEAGHISQDVKSIALAFYLSNPEDTDKLLASVTAKTESKPEPKKVSLSELLKTSPKKVERTWDDLDKAGELKRLKEINPEEFRRLFFAKFGTEYSDN